MNFYQLSERLGMHESATGPVPVRVVFVCIGNVDRSPMAEAIGRQMLGTKAQVSSAGCREGGRPASENAVLTMQKAKLSCAKHVSRQLDQSIIDNNDLVVFLDQKAAAHYKKMVPKKKFVVMPIKNPFKTDPDQFVDVAISIGQMMRRLAPLVFKMWDDRNKPTPGTPGAPPAANPSPPGSPSSSSPTPRPGTPGSPRKQP